MDEFLFAAWVLGVTFIGAYTVMGVYVTYLLVFDTRPEPKKEVAE